HLIEIGGVNAAIEVANSCARHRISYRPVPGKVGAENFSGAQFGGRNRQCGGKRAVEMGNQAHLKRSWQLGESAERNLMRTVERSRPEIPVGTIGIQYARKCSVLINISKITES